MIKFLSTCLLLLIYSNQALSQDCTCQDEFLTICYYSAEDYCSDPVDCKYTLDGQLMKDGLQQKLLNTSLFGPFGISNCLIKLQKLGSVSQVSEINSLKCDIVFIGALSENHTLNISEVSENELEVVKEWSKECEKNLTIVSQYEARVWGYQIENGNENPNTPDILNTENSIFDGPFGLVDSFNQGGTYQGIIASTPQSGFEVLARDVNNVPTIVLDFDSNDIILGDIGIFTNFGSLAMSAGPEINNPNDIFACNVFALGCGISSGALNVSQFVNLCDDESFELPDGSIVDQEGIYIDSLKSSEDCDSIIFTKIDKSISTTNRIDYIGCNDDGHTIELSGSVFNEANPFGEVIVNNSTGCDSLITVEMTFRSQDTAFFFYEICPGEEVQLGDLTFSQETNEEYVTQFSEGCDSVTFVEVGIYADLELSLPDRLTIDVTVPFTFPFAFDPNFEVQFYPENIFSCQSCANPQLLIPNELPELIQVDVTDINGCFNSTIIEMNYTCQPHLPNVIHLNSNTKANREFGIESLCELDDFRLSIYDRYGNSVWKTTDQKDKWEGYFNNSTVSSGVYVYEVSYVVDQESLSKVGTLTVLR